MVIALILDSGFDKVQRVGATGRIGENGADG